MLHGMGFPPRPQFVRVTLIPPVLGTQPFVKHQCVLQSYQKKVSLNNTIPVHRVADFLGNSTRVLICSAGPVTVVSFPRIV